MERRLVLASASPRRRELLERLGIAFKIVPADVDESFAPTGWLESIPRGLAARKARAVLAEHPGTVVLAADTIVVLGRRVLNKPETPDEARWMLRALRNRWHTVISGVAVGRVDTVRVAHVATHVRMRRYSRLEIDASIERGDPFDKAGGYAIQDERFAPVETWDGCYCNVVGLPLATTLDLLMSVGIDHEPRELLPQCATCPLFRIPPASPNS